MDAASTHVNGSRVRGTHPPAVPARRVLPHSLDSEASVLGGIILRNDLLDRLPTLERDAFYDHRHRIVFSAMRNLQQVGRPIDVVTLEHEIERDGKLDAVGGVAFLGDLTFQVPTAENVLVYAETVTQLYRNRRAIIALGSAYERAHTWQHDPSELIAEISGELARLEDLSKPPLKRLKLISIGQALEELETLAKAPVYPTPFAALNDAIGFGGFLGTQVYTVAAGTGRGKTTWVSHVAAHSAQTVPVIVVSYEMRPGYFVARKAAGVLGVHSNDILRGLIPMGKVSSAMPYPRMFLMHKPTLLELREAVAFITDKFGPPLVVVDYIQKLADHIALQQSRPDMRIATSQASETLCSIAERTGAAVVAVSAIGRGKGKILASPRKLEPYELVEVSKESGAVEYDGAGLIVLSLAKEFDGDERVATMTLAKVRFGEECHIDARYDGRRGTWRSLERVDVEARPDKVTTKPDDGAMSAAIIAVLKKHGPQSSKTKIWKLSEKSKQPVLSELDVMLERGSLVMTTRGFALPEQAAELNSLPPQLPVPGVNS